MLQNGDIVEIRTSKSAPGPSRDWLNIVKSGSARTKIKQWYKKERREENVLRGLQMLEEELKHNELSLDELLDDAILNPVLKRLSYATIDDMLAAIGYGGVTAARVANRMRDEQKAQQAEKKSVLDKVSAAAERREERAKKEAKAVHGILVEGLDNCLVKFSRCCTPVPGDDIIGLMNTWLMVMIPCIAITGPFNAGVTYVLRNWARDEHSFVRHRHRAERAERQGAKPLRPGQFRSRAGEHHPGGQGQRGAAADHEQAGGRTQCHRRDAQRKVVLSA